MVMHQQQQHHAGAKGKKGAPLPSMMPPPMPMRAGEGGGPAMHYMAPPVGPPMHLVGPPVPVIPIPLGPVYVPHPPQGPGQGGGRRWEVL